MTKYLSYERFIDHDLFYTRDELVNQYGPSILKSFTNSLIVKSEELFNEYKNTDLIVVNENENKAISKKLLHDILTDEGMYKYVQTNLDNDLGVSLRIDYIIDATTIASIKLTRAELMMGLSQIIPELTQIEQMRFSVIKNTLSMYSCEQKYRNYIHHVNIDGTDLEIKASILLDILNCDEKKFQEFLNGNINYGYDTDCLAYALVDFMERERILIKYVLPTACYERYRSICNFSLIDFESLNKNRITNDLDANGESLLAKITITDELREYLEEDASTTYSKLEKAIFYYIKLCEVLTLDENYFSDTNSLEDKHEDISYINQITPTNNKIIKYDFVILYAKLLSELGINFTLDQSLMAGVKKTNKLLTFRYGEYLVGLTSFANLDKNDLTNVKINATLNNLTSLNKNEFTKKKFNELVERIYREIIAKREKKELFSESLTQYKTNMDSKYISLIDKIYILLVEISRKKLKGVDSLAYQNKIFSNIFKDDDNVKLNFLCRETKDNYLSLVSIVSIKREDNYNYFLVDPDLDELTAITSEELTNILGMKKIYYIDDKKVPGIQVEVGEKYVK